MQLDISDRRLLNVIQTGFPLTKNRLLTWQSGWIRALMKLFDVLRGSSKRESSV